MAATPQEESTGAFLVRARGKAQNEDGTMVGGWTVGGTDAPFHEETLIELAIDGDWIYPPRLPAALWTILAERNKQYIQGRDKTDPDLGIANLVNMIRVYLIEQETLRLNRRDPNRVRERIASVAGLACAMLEEWDRQQEADAQVRVAAEQGFKDV